jgi:hypothetical protein
VRADDVVALYQGTMAASGGALCGHA